MERWEIAEAKMESIWTEGIEIRKHEPLPGDMEAPVVVIGAGLAGILTAYYPIPTYCLKKQQAISPQE